MLEFIYTYHLHYIFRIIVAGICGIVIGYERKNRAKEAGLRTHCIVACASALMMILSKYGFTDLVDFDGINRADGSRIASQVVSGIGFLGAGMIFVQKNTIKGLTTAAGIWATSGIGMTVGAGMYVVGIGTTFILLIAQILLHKKIRFVEVPKNKRIVFNDVTDVEFQEKYTKFLHDNGVIINDVSVTINEEDAGFDFVFDVEVHHSMSESALIAENPFKASVETVR